MSKKTIRPDRADTGRTEAPFRLSQVTLLVSTALMLGASGIHAQEAPKPSQDAASSATGSTQVESLETVTVRSRPRLSRLQDVPAAESVVSGAELTRELARDLGAITSRVAGVTFNHNNTRGASLSIRGLGKRGFAEFQDPSVLVTVDDISYALTQLGNFDFYDVDQVSVARGPQGTSGGKGGSAGAVNITSKGPSFTPSGEYALTYGQRETLIGNASLAGPIIDDLLAWRGTFTVNRGAGYYQNVHNERHHDSLYNTDRLAGRTQFLFTPTSDLRGLLTLEVEPRTRQVQNGLTENVESPLRYANGTLVDSTAGTSARSIFTGFTDKNGVYHGPREWFANRDWSYQDNYLNSTSRLGNVNFDQNQGQVVGYKGSSVKIDKTLDGGLTFSSITGWRQYSFDARNDEGTPFDIAKLGGGGVYYNQFSQEFRLSSEVGKPVEYTTGLYFLRTRNQVESHAGYGADAGAWYSTISQYESLYAPATASNRAAGRALLADSLNGIYQRQDTDIATRSKSWFGNVKIQFDPQTALSSGLRLTHDVRHMDYDSSFERNGSGALLNPSATSRGYQLGGFNSDAAGELTTNSAGQLALADALAQKYYGVNYAGLSADQKKQVAAAKAIRRTRIGALITGVTSDYNSGLLATANVSPSYKFNEEVTGYFTWQYGEKSGSPNVVNGLSATVKPERTQAFELGFKSNLLDKTLVLNAGAFLMNIRDYQQTVRVVDEWGTANNSNGDGSIVYANVQGNVDLVRTKGIELDAVYSGLKNTTLRASATYNDARYVHFKNAPFPVELSYLSSASNPYYDASGQNLAGAPKYVLNLGAEYRVPVFNDKSFHASFNTTFKTSYNNDEALSSYSVVPKGSVTDVSVGIGQLKKNFDVTLTVKNVFDDKRHEEGWTGYEPTPNRRWVGITFSGSI